MTYRFGDMTLDPRSGRLERAGRPVPLEPRAFEVLSALVERAGELVEHQTLIDLVWSDAAVTPHSLTQAISQLRRALNDDPRQPRLIETAHRRGYRFIAEIERLPSPPVAPRWRPPERLADLVGRARDLSDLLDRLASSRLVTLVGPGGVGKTQLALEAAHQAAPRFADGAAVIDLGPAFDAVDAQRLVADVIGAPERQGAEPGAAIASVLRDAAVLIVLDNCERVSDAAGRLAAGILAGARGVQVLATSQRPLDAPGEALARVAPLGWVAAHADMGPPDAVRLFGLRAAAVQPGFDVGSHATAVSEICRQLDGLPLAIELAAAQVRVLSPEQILDRLDSRFELLVHAGHTDTRHRTLRSTIEWSTSLLGPVDERFLEDVSVFPGGWDLDAAAAVAAEGESPGHALAHLTTLVDRSLVLADTAGPSARYRLLDSVRLFAYDRLVHAGRDAGARQRLLRHFAAIAARADREWYSPKGDAWLGRLQEDVSNLRAALQWSLEASDHAALGLQLAADLRWFWRAAGLFVEGCSWIERLLAAAVGAPSSVRARGEITYGLLAHHRHAFATARDALARGLERMTDAPSDDLASALSIVALNEALAGGADACTAAATRALEIAERLDLAWVAASAGLALGQRDAMRAEHDQAARAMTAAYNQSVRSGDVFLESYVATNLALQRFLLGDRAGSRALFVRALSLSRRLNNLRAIAGCFEGLAYLSADAGDPRGAARLMGAAARLRTITLLPLLPQWTRAHDQCRDRIAEAIGPEDAAGEELAGAQLAVDALAAKVVGV